MQEERDLARQIRQALGQASAREIRIIYQFVCGLLSRRQ